MSAADAAAAKRRELRERMLRGEGAGQAPAPIARRPVDARVPLSPAQRQVWLHAGMAPDAPIYNESVTFHRRGACDVRALEAAFAALVERHESWRASFRLEGGEPVQVIHPTVNVSVPMSDLTGLPEEERDAAAIELATRDAQRPIDLARPPLARARIVRLGEEDHRLYLTLHHIIFDGVAMYRVILPELAALYEAFSAGRAAPLPAPAIGYGDYAVWAAGTPVSTRDRDYWRAALAGLPAKLELPADRLPPASRTHAGSMEVFHLPHRLTEELKALARSADATLYMVLLAGFTALLHRHTGADDVTVGGVTDLRRRPELDRVVGYFLNTLPLRTRLAAETPFADHLHATRETVLGALAASEMPFDQIARVAGVQARAGEHPLFDILFSVEPPAEPFPPGWDLTQMDVVVGGAKFDIYLELDERPDGMAARFLYSTERFDVGTIRRFIDQWLRLLEGVVANPACAIADLPLAGLDATRPMSGPETPPPFDGRTVPEQVAWQARATPDATAIRFEETCWSYRELDAAADQVARQVRAHGLGRDDLVAVTLERSPALVASLLGVLRAGAAYLPLDPRQPVARLRQIAAQARIGAVLTEAALVGLVPADGLPTIVVDDAQPDHDLPPAASPVASDLAYVLYTSGSTGEPKGVEIGHGALANLLGAMAERPGFAATDRLLAVTTVSFDIAMLELFLPLVCGGEIVLAPFETARDPAALRGLIEASRPTVMQATPATWAALIEAGWAGDRALRILSGGEALSRPLAEALLGRGGALWNLYGPTETCIWSAVARVRSGDGAVPIGRAIANTQIHVLDHRGRPVAPGMAGELLIGGLGLARGYRDAAALTASRFAPFTAGGGRLYRTGDRARASVSGDLIHLGRVDAEEKIRGYRVAVEEVEGVLALHPGVSAAAVRGWPDDTGSRTLAGYYVASADPGPAMGELATFVAKRLPDYMVPSSFTALPALPMTASGKVDRRALPSPAPRRPDADFEPPASDAERRMAAIWCDILGVERIGRADDFFDLGGHSLLAARLLARVSEAWGKPIGFPALLRARRLAELTALMEASRPAESPAVLIQPRGWRPPFLWTEPGPSFVRLAARIGRDQPLLGVPIEAPEGGSGGERSFLDHAATLVATIRRIQPTGPYYLGGWCNGGILTYAAASLMEREGDEIRLLVLGDAFNPARPPVIDRSLSFRLTYHLDQLTGSGDDRLAYLRERRDRALERLGLRAPRPHWSRDEARAEVDRALAGYRPDRYAGPVLLFQSHDRFVSARMDEEWRELLDGTVAYHRFPGGHDTLLNEPHLEAVATMLREALVSAQGERQIAALRDGHATVRSAARA